MGGATVDLAALSESVAARVRRRAACLSAYGAVEPGAAWSQGLTRRRTSVAGDRDAIDRLLVNLIDNAVRYAKSQVTVAVRREDAWGALDRDR